MKISKFNNFSKLYLAVLSVGLLMLVVGIQNPLAYADHGSNFRVELISPGSEIVTFRDSTNVLLQSATVSVDTSTVKAGFITVILEEKDANLQSGPNSFPETHPFFRDGVEMRFSSVRSTSSGQETVEVKLTETDANSGLFTGRVDIGTGPTTDERLQLGLGDDITVLYKPEPQGVGRFTAEYGGVTETTGISIEKRMVNLFTKQ